MAIRFDESLPKLVKTIQSAVGVSEVARTVFIRDGEGRLSAVIDEELGEVRLAHLEALLVAELGTYAREDGVIRDRDGYGATRLLREGFARPRVTVADIPVFFLDRRTVGADWLLPPQSAAGVPRIAFASLKGGVGRSTALAVLAAYLSDRGQRVLAVDLDLEAPGIGTMLISSEALPKFGTLDYLVENGLTGIDDDFIENCLGSSFLGESGAKVTIFPAIGTETIANPAGALSKLGRAYLEDIDSGGATLSLTDQIREMLDRAADASNADVILIDARAGLHETTAAAILGLGAEVLLFGSNEPQTYLGYNLLISHLTRFHSDEYDTWKDRLQFVHAKASGDPDETADAAAKFGDLYSLIYGSSEQPVDLDDLDEDDFEMVWVDEDIEVAFSEVREPVVIRILDDSRYRGFDPLLRRNLLQNEIFEATFAELLAWVNEIVPALTEINDGV